MSQIQVSVIIVSWNTRDLLRKCLQSVFTTLPPLTFEVFVVDNTSRDGSAAMVSEEFPAVHLIASEENLGFARANNLAIGEAGGQYILVLNPDTELIEGMVAKSLEFLENDPSSGMVGGELLNTDGSFQAGYFDFPTFRSQIRVLLGREGQHFKKWKATYSPLPLVREVDWVSGAFMVVRRAAIEEAGLLDERFFMFAEETEWCIRIHKAGWKIHYLSDVKTIHHHRQSTKQVASQMSAHAIRGQLILFWTHYPKPQAFTLTLLSLALALYFIARGLLWLKFSAQMRRHLRCTGLTMIGYCFEVPQSQQPRVPYLVIQKAT